MQLSTGSPEYVVRDLLEADDRSGFDCGENALNRFFRKRAHAAQAEGESRTFVAVSNEGAICGFGTVIATNVGTGNKVVAGMLIARFGVATPWQKRGVGKALMREVVKRAKAQRRLTGCHAIIVHAKVKTKAHEYYGRLGFSSHLAEPDGDTLPMILSMSAIDQREALAAANR